MKKTVSLLLGILILNTAGLFAADKSPAPSAEHPKIQRFFCWGSPRTEEDARRFAQAGVTDILVSKEKQIEWARKYGMRSHWRVFTPAGPHPQVMTPEEEKNHIYISGKDLPREMPYRERAAIIKQRQIEKKHQFGGEAVMEPDTLAYPINCCFISDTDFSLSRIKLEKILDSAPDGVSGIFVDYVGFTNHHGCYCEDCLKKYREYLAKNGLPDTRESRDRFYGEQLIVYYNRIIDFVKERKSGFTVTVHLWPDFQPDHLFGNKIKADFCGQTVAWYFSWPAEKIRSYTKYVVEHAKDHYANQEGIPFLGLNAASNTALAFKSPEVVERELQEILAAGGRSLMVCNGPDVIKPGYFEVFRKYCAPITSSSGE